jgi:hypothetical protein
MFADYHHFEFGLLYRRSITADTSKRTQNHRCQRSTILSGTRQNPTLVNNLTKIGLSQARREHQLHAWGWSAFRGIQKIRNSSNSSIQNLTRNAHQFQVFRGAHPPSGAGVGVLAETNLTAISWPQITQIFTDGLRKMPISKELCSFVVTIF